jgi:aarF domain-containing kinase
MAGRRLVDAAKLFNASRSVAQKHIALRSNQLDAFNKTSTLAKAVKNQTDRITLTAAAAIELSKRFSDEAPSYARAAAEQAAGTPRHANDIPRKETVAQDVGGTRVKGGLEQDHHYERSEENTTVNPPPDGELEIEQKEAPRRPLPDGTIPSAGVTLEQEEKGQDTFSERPVPEAPKQPLAEEKHDQTRQEDEGIKPVESDESTIPLPGKPRGGSSAAADTIPSHANDFQQPSTSSRIKDLQKGHDRDVFYSRSVESQPTPESQPRMQIPIHMGTKQASDDHVNDKQMNQDVFYSVPAPGQQQETATEQDVPPEGVNTDVFHSRRVAQLLGRDPYSRKEHSRTRMPSSNPHIPPQYQAGHGHGDEASEQTSSSNPRQDPKAQTTEKEMQALASQLAQDAQSSANAAPEVRCSMSYIRSMLIS